MPKDPERPRRIEKLCEDTARACDNIQQLYSRNAQDAGYARTIIKDVGSYFGKLPDEPSLENIEASLLKFRAYVKAKSDEITNLPNFSEQAYTVATSTATSASVMSGFIYKTYEVPKPPQQIHLPHRNEDYASKLDRIDPELGRTYRSVWETFYGTTESSGKNALFAMRQVFDHLFDKLAPDDEVRRSISFKPKEGINPNQVYREERIRYAAQTHVKDKALADLLESEANLIIKTYKKLNEAHNRGPLDSSKVKDVLMSMKQIIERWIDALDLT